VLGPFADEDTDQALFEEAKIELSKANYTAAVTLFSQMSSKFLAESDIVNYHASAYAGRCGLDFLNFLLALENLGTTTLFQMLMTSYTGDDQTAKESRIADCDQATTIVEAAGLTAGDRDDDGNLLLAFVLFAKIGNTFARFADDDNGGGGAEESDGAVDTGWSACVDDTDNFPEADVRQYGVALMKTLNALAALSSSTVGSGVLTDLDAICTTLAGAPFNAPDLCNRTDPADFTADEVRALRTLAHEGTSLGLGSCTASPDDLTNCVCL